MKPLRAWKWLIGGLLCSAIAGSTYFLTAARGIQWWNLRGTMSTVSPADAGDDVPVESLLSEALASQVRELVARMMNPAEATDAAAKLRKHFEEQIHQPSTAGPSMAFFLQCLAQRFESLDAETRQICLKLMSDVFGWFGQNETSCWTAVLAPSKSILSAALSDPSSDISVSALQFVRACWEWAPPDVSQPVQRKSLGTWKAELHARCVELLRSREDRVRAAAGVTVVSVPIESAAARGLILLSDESPVVRRAMLLALAEQSELLSSEDVIGFLRDPSSAVRTTAEIVLTSRGLSPEQVALAMRATDPSPLVRAQAPRHIVESTAVDRIVWLTHLSRDAAVPVRLEAARALAQVDFDECRQRLAEMAEADPDINVRHLAHDLVRQTPAHTGRDSASTTTPEAPVSLPAVSTPKTN